jgi:hypothetical protein
VTFSNQQQQQSPKDTFEKIQWYLHCNLELEAVEPMDGGSNAMSAIEWKAGEPLTTVSGDEMGSGQCQ